MTYKNTFIAAGLLVAVLIAGYVVFSKSLLAGNADQNLDATPQQVTLSGTYVCLPHTDTTGPQTEECAFGLQADDGAYYAVNFGSSAGAMEQFQAGAHIMAEGFVVLKEALSSDQWSTYNMKGIFTITKVLSPAPTQGKININVVCESALAYMSFPDAVSAETFVTECKEGKHPEVIERYKQQMGLGDGAAI